MFTIIVFVTIFIRTNNDNDEKEKPPCWNSWVHIAEIFCQPEKFLGSTSPHRRSNIRKILTSQWVGGGERGAGCRGKAWGVKLRWQRWQGASVQKLCKAWAAVAHSVQFALQQCNSAADGWLLDFEQRSLLSLLWYGICVIWGGNWQCVWNRITLEPKKKCKTQWNALSPTFCLSSSSSLVCGCCTAPHHIWTECLSWQMVKVVSILSNPLFLSASGMSPHLLAYKFSYTINHNPLW